MKVKQIFTMLMMLVTLLASAQTSGGGSVVNEEHMRATLDVLNSIEGYVFIEKGADKSRDLTATFTRTDAATEAGINADDLKALDWRAYNENIVEVTDEGVITGLKFGETIVEMTEEDGTIHNYIVFVCPTVTVISPDGVIYTHQKIYNQKMKIDFSQSAKYVINCVMAEYDGNVYDVTDMIDPETGHYESNDQITSDVYYTVSMERDLDDNFLSKTPIRVMVANGVVEFVAEEGLLENSTIEMTDLKGGVILAGAASSYVDFGGETPRLTPEIAEGIYFLNVTVAGGETYNYKIIIKKY